jgi:Fe-S-cluster containining protein
MDAENFQKILANCKDYVPLEGNSWQQNFIFGESVIEAILDLNFECTKCGKCCIDAAGEPCPQLKDFGKDNLCKIYCTENYPVTCATYPFIIDETASEGQGARYSLTHNLPAHENKPYVNWEFGIIDGLLTLLVHPHEPCWNSSQNSLHGFYIKILNELLTLDNKRTLNPPQETLISLLDSRTGAQISGAGEKFKALIKTTEYEKILSYFRQRINEKPTQNYIAAKLFKARHKDYSLGI